MAEDIAQRGSEIPYGGAQQLEAAAEAVEAFDEAEEAEAGFDEFGELLEDDDEELEGFDSGPLDVPSPRLSGPEGALFGPSTRLTEPVTAGAAFGPGAGGLPRLDDDQFVRRFMDQMASRPGAPEEITRLAERIKRGE